MNKALSKTLHTAYISVMFIIVIATTIYLSYVGFAYYNTPFEERFYAPNHDWFKPSGLFGHGLGIVGTLMMLFGVVIYIARKRYGFMSNWIRLKYLLEFHIFLCILGPILVLFHTAFKFGGIVSVAFWSMVLVVLSGFIGRFIYVQIPHTIEGRALTMSEVEKMKEDMKKSLSNNFNLENDKLQLIATLTEKSALAAKNTSILSKFFEDRKTIKTIRSTLTSSHVSFNERQAILSIVKEELSLSNKISRLRKMKKLFEYWHVAHLPFALVMLVIVLIHVGVTLAFGYKWIF